jgi:hypothetical protein
VKYPAGRSKFEITIVTKKNRKTANPRLNVVV